MDLLSGLNNLNLHFNRTNIIGVPGHPNGYDDTFNSVEITPNVEINTVAGDFMTTYICITDNQDGVKSWNFGIMTQLGIERKSIGFQAHIQTP